MTAAKDATVRIWKENGDFIGFFGQTSPWDLNNSKTFLKLPPDVEEENRIEAQRNEILLNRKEIMKKQLLETWTGINSYC